MQQLQSFFSAMPPDYPAALFTSAKAFSFPMETEDGFMLCGFNRDSLLFYHKQNGLGVVEKETDKTLDQSVAEQQILSCGVVAA